MEGFERVQGVSKGVVSPKHTLEAQASNEYRVVLAKTARNLWRIEVKGPKPLVLDNLLISSSARAKVVARDLIQWYFREFQIEGGRPRQLKWSPSGSADSP
jgi:hypothetical protein